MKDKMILLGAALSALAFMTGCATCEKTEAAKPVIAVYSAEPVRMDGKLDEGIWKKAPAYPMIPAKTAWDNSPPDCKAFYAKKPIEYGEYKAVWTDQYLYIGLRFNDTDIVAEGKEDQEHHYSVGDTGEIFLKPANASYYWELYVTPTNKKTSFFYQGRGHLGLPSGFAKEATLPGMKTAVYVSGTLNRSADTDQYWSAEVAIPISEINQKGVLLKPGVPWKIFFTKVNFTCKRPGREMGSYPQQERCNYHIYEDYADLILQK